MRDEALLVALVLVTCGDRPPGERVRAQAEQAIEAAEEAADGAVAAVEQKADATVERVKTGASAAADGSIESIVATGTQLAPAVADLTAALGEVVDRETTIEPIYQRVGDAEGAKRVDRAIGDMPRTEVIDGLTVGFRDLSTVADRTHVSESGYLLAWRQDDHLVGLVYRSRRQISLDKLVDLAPRLISAARRVGKVSGDPGGGGTG